jgi:hypothetical protein
VSENKRLQFIVVRLIRKDELARWSEMIGWSIPDLPSPPAICASVARRPLSTSRISQTLRPWSIFLPDNDKTKPLSSVMDNIWVEFFRHMQRRQLRMPLLVTTDGAPGIIKAIVEFFPEALDAEVCVSQASEYPQ